MDVRRSRSSSSVRTEGGLYRFLEGFHRPMLAFHEIFDGPVDESHWTDWLRRACAPST